MSSQFFTGSVLRYKLIDYLNGLLAHDAVAMQELFEARVDCGKAMGTNPDVSVMMIRNESGNTQYLLGVMGVLNGFLNGLGGGSIEVEYSQESGELKGFRKQGGEEEGDIEQQVTLESQLTRN